MAGDRAHSIGSAPGAPSTRRRRPVWLAPVAVVCLLAALSLTALAGGRPVAGQGIASGPVAGTLRAADRVTIGSDETIAHDLYVSGGEVRHNGRIEGDLVVVGGQVDVDGSVTGDLLVA